MIQLSARILQLIQQPVPSIFYLVSIRDLYMTTYPSNLFVDGKTYVSSNLIFAVESPKMTSVVDRDLYRITLADSALSMAGLYDSVMLGSNVNVSIGFVDYYTNLPEVNEIITLYEGIVQDFNYNIDTSSDGEILSEITCSNPMADLDSVSPFYTSKDFLRKLNPQDTSFDQIYEGSGGINLIWGKE